SFFFMRPTGKHFPKGFHQVLNHVKMIDDDLRVWQDRLNCWTKRCTHIHAYCFHSVRIAQSFKQLHDIFLFSPIAYLEARPSPQDRTESYHTDALCAAQIHQYPRFVVLGALPAHLRYALSFRAFSLSMHTDRYARNESLPVLLVRHG